MIKFVIAVILSAALIGLAPKHDTPVNNLGSTAALTKPAGQVHHKVTAPAQEVKQVETPAPQEAKTQPETKAVTASAAPQQVQGCNTYLPLIDQYNWNHQIAFAIMKAENIGCNPSLDNAGLNLNGSVDYGLFQVNSVHADMVQGNLEALRDPATNIAIAYRIYSGSGWTAWSTYNDGKYLLYLM